MLFAAWCSLGLLAHLQIIPLAFTANEVWFYFTMAGVLGMFGTLLTVYRARIRLNWFLVIAATIIGLLGVRTALRAADWSGPIVMAYHDIVASKDNFNAENDVATDLLYKGHIVEAKLHAERSIAIYPTGLSYDTLALCFFASSQYPQAQQTFERALSLNKFDPDNNPSLIYDNYAAMLLYYGVPIRNAAIIRGALQKFPRDTTLWTYLALLEYKYNDAVGAKGALSEATRYGQVPDFIYTGIMTNKSVMISIEGNTTIIHKPMPSAR